MEKMFFSIWSGSIKECQKRRIFSQKKALEHDKIAKRGKISKETSPLQYPKKSNFLKKYSIYLWKLDVSFFYENALRCIISS